MGILTGHGESSWGQEFPVGILETRPGGRAELSHGRFLLDLGIFAWVEQALDTAENWPAEVGHKPTTQTCTIWDCGPRMV